MTRQRPAQRKPLRAASPEEKFYGVAACRALWRARPQDIVRVYIREDLVGACGDMLKWAARERKAYHVVEEDDLDRLTRSEHHQGICVLAKERAQIPFSVWRSRRGTAARSLLVYLDGVENPHNFGAIVRTCAHFGVEAVLGVNGRLPRMSPSACRVAEGGAEHVALVTLDDAASAFKSLKKEGYVMVAAQAAATAVPMYGQAYTAKTMLILGAEQTGISQEIARLADIQIHIPGTGAVESLNVSVAAALMIGEYRRQYPAG